MVNFFPQKNEKHLPRNSKRKKKSRGNLLTGLHVHYIRQRDWNKIPNNTIRENCKLNIIHLRNQNYQYIGQIMHY